MLRIGLTGGIGAGKSTVSATFADCGGVIVDGDVIAREVVEPGTEGLAALVEAFGEDILLPDGALNRPALAAKAFQNDEQRAKLNGIVHPLVGRRRQEIIDSVPDGTVVVEDIPLLVETGMAPFFPLVVVVWADEETRVTRLIKRGLPEHDARARMKAQASDEQRRAIADVLLDNSGTQDEIVEAARRLWYERVLPLAENIRTGEVVRIPPRLVTHDPAWSADAQRIINRVKAAAGAKVVRADHIGSTSVAGLEAKDVVDVQVTVASLDDADEIAGALTAVGYPRVPAIDSDVPHDDSGRWGKRYHGAADPGRPANIHVRVDGWPNQRFALLFPAWLAAEPAVRDEYLEVKRAALNAPDYADAKEPWFAEAYPRALAWAEATGWRP
ncbi:dephospho-CoA kinase [Mycolicibacterium litorale]|uniref:Dephospho-CoA kinase n=1 Tax=Mycolicibacterium litorale TaxID=758802 RepID=A0A6S6PAC6_9MYCO|nr:dephospho-CoA kinase [Mycolicibacterium litorale]BCI53640.1 dephospho-CoA kinase [Mycolicibacterium litorale]